MDRNEYAVIGEKDQLLPQKAKNEDLPSQKIRKTNLGLGVVVATFLFLWWSIYAIPSLLSIGDDGPENSEVNLSFAEVRKSRLNPCYNMNDLAHST